MASMPAPKDQFKAESRTAVVLITTGALILAISLISGISDQITRYSFLRWGFLLMEAFFLAKCVKVLWQRATRPKNQSSQDAVR